MKVSKYVLKLFFNNKIIKITFFHLSLTFLCECKLKGKIIITK